VQPWGQLAWSAHPVARQLWFGGLGLCQHCCSGDCAWLRAWAVARRTEAIAVARNLASFAHVLPVPMPRRRRYSALTRLSRCRLWQQRRHRCVMLSAAAGNSRSPPGVVAGLLGVIAVPSSVGISRRPPHVVGLFLSAWGHSRHGACSSEEVRGCVGRSTPGCGPLGA
jgi:hypothetical protein